MSFQGNKKNKKESHQNICNRSELISRSAFSVTSPDAVLSAIGEYDRLGRDAFLKKYGYHKAVSYLIVHKDHKYDSKAIIGVAFGYQYSTLPLTNDEFSGGKVTVEKALTRMGFSVKKQKGNKDTSTKPEL